MKKPAFCGINFSVALFFVILLPPTLAFEASGGSFDGNFNSFGTLAAGNLSSADGVYAGDVLLPDNPTGTWQSSDGAYIFRMAEYFDQNAPSIIFTSPVSDSQITSDSVDLAFTPVTNGNEIVKFWVKLNGGQYIDNGLSTSYTFSGLQLGTNTIYVKAMDYLDLNSQAYSVSFTRLAAEDAPLGVIRRYSPGGGEGVQKGPIEPQELPKPIALVPENKGEKDACLALNCDDSNPCTSDACSVGQCANAPLDGSSCGVGKTCRGGACLDSEKPAAIGKFVIFGAIGFAAFLILIAVVLYALYKKYKKNKAAKESKPYGEIKLSEFVTKIQATNDILDSQNFSSRNFGPSDGIQATPLPKKPETLPVPETGKSNPESGIAEKPDAIQDPSALQAPLAAENSLRKEESVPPQEPSAPNFSANPEAEKRKINLPQ